MTDKSVVVCFNVLMAAFVFGMVVLLTRLRARNPVRMYLSSGFAVGLLGCLSALAAPIELFGKIQLASWVVFLHFPVYLLSGASLLFRRSNTASVFGLVTATVIVLIGAYSFLVEPFRLEVTRVTISSIKLATPVRVAVIADLQTDNPGAYEEMAMKMVMDESPDLILFAGDYLQIAYNRYLEKRRVLNGILRSAGLSAPLGIYAVKGNCDWRNEWKGIFRGLPVTFFDVSETLDLGPLILTGLTEHDSMKRGLLIKPQEALLSKHHIVLGHFPDFSMGSVNANLLIAGHTHGGQFQIPFIGPILTLSRVPRSWASGVTNVGTDKVLIVSRGIGMERGNAPRMRLFCRPEVIIVDLAPIKRAGSADPTDFRPTTD
ncbi:MAG: metallophosphoesterase [Pseudomonadota bacterium]